MKDNKKTGKARGANGKPRSRKQMIAIALNAAGKSKKTGPTGMNIMKKVLGGRWG